MKKIILSLLAVALFSTAANAQLGGLGNAAAAAAKRALEKKLDNAVEKAVDKAVEKQVDEYVGDVDITSADSNAKLLTPEQMMAKFPKLPTEQDLVNYAIEMQKDSPSALKLLTNGVSKFLTKVNIAMIDVSNNISQHSGTWAKEVNDEVLAQMGLTQAQWDKMSEAEQQKALDAYAEKHLNSLGLTSDDIAKMENMSEEEQQAFVQKKIQEKIAKDGEDNAYSKMSKEYEQLAKVYASSFDLIDMYDALSNQIDSIYNDARTKAEEIWKTKYASKTRTDALMGQFYRETLPLYFAAMQNALVIRKQNQLPLAHKIDQSIAETAKKSSVKPAGPLSWNYAQMLAVLYLAEGNQIMNYFTPSK